MILFCLCFRVFIAIATRSYFQPDEYFQALEPAHRFVFGYGHLTWEWVNPTPLRSILYPALNIPVFYLLKLTGLDVYPVFTIHGPRAVHGMLAALTDIRVGKLSRAVLGDLSVPFTYLLSLTSFFHSLALSRSLSNSLETSLTTTALGYFPWAILTMPPSRPRLYVLRSALPSPSRIFVTFAVLACAVRPTSAIIWIYMFSILFWRLRTHVRLMTIVLRDCAVIGLTILLAMFTLDTCFYGKPTLTLVNFLRVNASPVSLFYGSSPWHYYLSQALPILCTTSLPFALHGVYVAFKYNEAKVKALVGCIGWTITVYSFMGHKEWRFLHPLLPMLHVLASRSIIELFIRDEAIGEVGVDSKSCRSLIHLPLVVPVLLLLPIPAAFYAVFFHGSGQIEVMSYLRQLPVDDHTTIGFLMPCHSTPWQAYLHREDLANPGKMWALGCEPPLGVENSTRYRDQTDVFFESPVTYMKDHFPPCVNSTFPLSPLPSSVPDISFVRTLLAVERTSGSWDLNWRHEWPKYIVIFGALLREPGMQDLLEKNGYSEVWKGGREWEGEGKRKGGVRVWTHVG
ncbi:glycosyltransferase family 22 protein [Phlebopus sp. FC_14]|nr:glycosyltransferase family 22 protein [Phlebopus sp. FC_14]